MSPSRIRLLWTCVGAAALAIGAAVAVIEVPEARFGVSPTGLFRPYLVEFSLIVALPLAIAQWLMLFVILSRRGDASIFASLLWVPATVLGVVAMLLPMWGGSASSYAGMPVLALMPLLPGAVLLGACQAALLKVLVGKRGYWIVSTIVGVAFGTFFGLIVALSVGYMLEAVWAGVTGLGLCGCQSLALADVLARRNL